MRLHSQLTNRSRWCRFLERSFFAATIGVVVFTAALANSQEPAAETEASPETKPARVEPGDATTPPPAKPEVATPSGRLPWAKSGSSQAALGKKQAASPRELLVNVDDSQLSALVDGRPLVIDEDETLGRILYRYPRFGNENIERLCHPKTDWADFAKQPEAHRLEIHRLRGRAIRVEKVELLPEQAIRFEYSRYYRVTMKLTDVPNSVIVCARQIPDAWKDVENIDERASVYGLFLKKGDDAAAEPELYFAGVRVAWHPDREISALGVTADQVVLGDLGMDWGLFDQVRGLDGKPLTADDNECFYQLLATAGNVESQELAAKVSTLFNFRELLQKPGEQHGKLMTLEGRARLVTKIDIEDRDTRERLGFSHYWQVCVFVSLGDDQVRLVADSGKDVPVLNLGFPMTCVVREIPAALRQKAERGEDLNEFVRFTGVNLRLWSYHSEMLDRYAREKAAKSKSIEVKRQLQASPMFVGPSVQMAIPPAPPNHEVGMSVLIGLVAAVIGGVALAVWLFKRTDKMVDRMRNQADGTANSHNDKPDFSGLK